MAKKVLVATEKPFASQAVDAIKEVLKGKADYKLELLEKYTEKKELLDAIKDAAAVIIRSDKVTKEVIEAADELKLVIRAGAGYDNVDLEAATAKGVIVENTPGQNSNAVAELAFGMMVYIARNKFNPKSGSELREKVLGIHGFGNVGQYVSRIAKGFGMEVIAFDPFVDKEAMAKFDVKKIEDLKELYDSSDYISLNVPSNAKTKKSVNYELLKDIKDSAIIVNTARKDVVCEESLIKILEEKKNFCYLSDVAPDAKDEILAKYEDRCFFTPKKMGAQTMEANVNAARMAANHVLDYFEKGVASCKVN